MYNHAVDLTQWFCLGINVSDFGYSTSSLHDHSSYFILPKQFWEWFVSKPSLCAVCKLFQ